MEDREIIELFFQRSQEAVGELDRKYGAMCRSLAYRILNSWDDAEECVNDGYLGVWNAIPPAEPEPLSAYLTKVIRNISLNRYYRQAAAKRGGVYTVAMEEAESCFRDAATVEDEVEARELAGILQEFLDTLTVKERVIFMRRYAYADTYAAIAGRVGISEKNVSVRLSLIRGKLRKYLRKRGVLV